ncbi:M14 family metallopeptidase [Pleomorphovibrio marinus]|uniref:M14 family metallopeptidase n=1 Tax=Pleomorphovibrio marinus TaxID=2164132 RepID=UPI000E0C9865|nr:M14 family metallopeptidase [Pleomorphovibrio marinus]
MKIRFTYHAHLFLYFMAAISCKSSTGVWQGQGAIQEVTTTNKPIQLQYKGTQDIGKGIFASNDYEGARMNGISLSRDTLITVLITPENTTINPSPWYAFKVWADEKKGVTMRLTYPEGTYHRYFPKVSRNGEVYQNLDSTAYRADTQLTSNGTYRATTVDLSLEIGPDTLWIASQELVGTKHVEDWKDTLLSHSYIQKIKTGESHEGRELEVLKIGQGEEKQMLMVMALQHPPEIPGYLAMKAFISTICEDSSLAAEFRKKYVTYLLPMANPDGVVHGHWRHNRGGVDINRDWKAFEQPETRAIRDFMEKAVQESEGKFIFALDFHSTWEDIYYTINEELEGNFPGLVPQMIRESATLLKDYTPNIRASPGMESGVTSNSYFFFSQGAEALTYEVGDNTPREFVKEKGRATALKLMEILVNQ